MENFSIPFWAEDDRPREKMMLKGRTALSNAELLAIILGSGSRKKSAVELAQEILNSCGNNLRELSKKMKTDLCTFDGIGEAKAISIMAAMELARRRDSENALEKPKIISSHKAYALLKPILSDLYHEEFYAIFLNKSNYLISIELISIGGFSSTIADSRIIFRKALEAKATSMILAHNHPSGNCQPSEADLKLTKSLVSKGNILDIPVLDHIIVSDLSYFSFADNAMMSEL
jgi:DNA repair protein RadC